MQLIFRIRRLRQNFWVALLLALPLLGLAIWLRFLLGEALEGVPFITLFPAILIAALIGGLWIGVIVTIVCAVAAIYWFLPPYESMQLIWPSGVIAMLFFLGISAFQLYVVELFDRALDALERERDRSAVMFRELQHRVANNMQFIAGLSHLQRRAIAADPSIAEAVVADMHHRLETISRIHRRLYDPSALSLPLTQYLQEMCTDVLDASGAKNIVCVVEALPTSFDITRLITLSLLVNEIITNSVKHAFSDGRAGTISIRLDREADNYALTIADTGRGLPDDFALEHARGLGFGIMQGLVGQLGGEMEFVSDGGTTMRVTFPA
jgi:two-component sensor histidine kinase